MKTRYEMTSGKYPFVIINANRDIRIERLLFFLYPVLCMAFTLITDRYILPESLTKPKSGHVGLHTDYPEIGLHRPPALGLF